MDLILLVSFIIIIILGYKLIDVVFDKVFPDIEIIDVPSFTGEDNALLFANKFFDKGVVEDLFKGKKLNCIFLEEIKDLDTSIRYKYLIAAGDSDLDNMTICSICSKMLGVEKFIAICNASNNRKVYEDNHIPYLFASDISIISLALFLFN